MFIVRPIRSGKQNIALIFDTTTSTPLLYPLLYSCTKLSSKAYNTQLACLQAIKSFYEFWFTKYGCSFCFSFFRANTNPQIAVNEIESFQSYLLCDKLDLTSNLSFSRKSVETISGRVRALLQFIHFLNDEFVSIRYIDLVPSEVVALHNYIAKRLVTMRRDMSRTSNSALSKNYKHQSYSSLTNQMTVDLFELLRPSTAKQPNKNNPFKKSQSQFRNFLIYRLLINYGLRVSELLLLELDSLKRTSRGTYALVITDTSDPDDPRVSLGIKTEASHRVMELDETDYRLVQFYIEYLRPKNTSLRSVFLTTSKPYKALDYQAVRFMSATVNNKFQKEHPYHFDLKYINSIDRFTLHMCRHTWATFTLSAIYKAKKAEIIRTTKLAGIAYTEKGLMDEAKDQLRKLGGWSHDSAIPDLYAARFIQDKANESNLLRLKSSSPCDDLIADLKGDNSV